MSTPAPPTATPHNQTGVAPGTSIALSTLFTYSFAAGDTVLGFDFKETTSNGGYITDNNGNHLTPGVLYGSSGTGIPISELSQYHFVVGPGGTSDTINFNVEDQYYQISTVVSATVTAAAATPAPPTATPHNQTGVAPGTSIALSTLFTYSFAAGDTVLGFDFKETTSNGGYITDNNGNHLTPGVLYGSSGTGIPISELSQYHFVVGPGGTSDTINFNVEDQYYQISTVVSATVTAAAATPAPPTATPHNQTGVAPGTSIALSTLFTYSFAAGDTVLGFDFKETTSNGGYITDNNGNHLTPGVLYGSSGTGIPISELSQYHFVAGPGGASDTVNFNVEDQYSQISTVVSATVSAVAATPAPPTATPHNQTGVAPGTSIALSTLFTYSFAAGDTVLGFDFKETTSNGGYITDNNGNHLTPGVLYGSSGTGIPISELSQYHFVAGPGGTSDTINFNVEDQYYQISTVVSATVSAQGGGGSTGLGSDVATAIAEISSQVSQGSGFTNDLGQNYFYLDDKTLVATIASEVASLYYSGSNYVFSQQGLINPISMSSSSISYNQCVALIEGLDQYLSPQTSNWVPNQQVDLNGGVNSGVNIGAPIATFLNGTYSQEHAGIFLGYGSEAGSNGFFMLDQYVNQPSLTPNTQPPEVRFHPFNTAATEYYTIVTSGGGGGGGTGYAGFDAEHFPSTPSTMPWIATNTNLTWCGYYLFAPNQGTNTGWLGQRAYLENTLGLKLAPLYVGEQDPIYVSNWNAQHPGDLLSTTLPSSTQGQTDGTQAANEMASEGFKKGSVIFLDWEDGGLSGEVNHVIDEAYIVSWCRTVAGAGYIAGVYCPRTDAATIQTDIQPYNINVVYWVANPNWQTYDSTEFSFNSNSKIFPNVDPSVYSDVKTGSGYPGAGGWQYQTGFSLATINGNYTIDLDTASASFYPLLDGPSQQGVSFTVSPQTATEGDKLTFRISIQNPNYAATPDYLLYYNTSDGTAKAGTDYNGIANQVAVHFTASSAQFIDVTVQTLTENFYDGTDTFNFNVYDNQHALLEQVQGTIIAPPSTLIQTDGSTSLVEAGNHFYLCNVNSGTGPALQYAGAAVVAGAYGAWTPIGTEQTASGYEIVWKFGSANQYLIWNTDSSGNDISMSSVVSGTSLVLETAETVLHQDLNNDGVIGPPPLPTTVIESFGSTSLVEVGTNFFFYPVGGSSGPELQYAGAAVVAGAYGAWAPIGTEQTASGYDVVWKFGSANQYLIWNTDSSGNTTSIGAVLSDTSLALETAETVLHQDLNGDGVIGPPPLPTTIIESFGSTSLVEVGTNFFLRSISSGTGPELQYGGAAVVAGAYGAWAPIGTEQTASGYEVVWKFGSANQYLIWNTDSSGNTTSIGAVLSSTSLALETAETVLHQDLNGDGVIGPPPLPTTIIESFGSTSLVEVGTNFFLRSISSGIGPELQYGGAAVVAGAYGAWAPIGAEQTASGYEVVWKFGSANQYLIWNTDSSGNDISMSAVLSGTSLALETAETVLHQDLNGDGVIGPPPLPTTVIESSGSTSLVEVGTNFFFYPVGGSLAPSCNMLVRPLWRGRMGPGLRSAQSRPQADMRSPGSSAAPISISSGTPTAAATTSP